MDQNPILAVNAQCFKLTQAAQDALGAGGASSHHQTERWLWVLGQQVGHHLILGGHHQQGLTQTWQLSKSLQGVHHHGKTRQQRVLFGYVHASSTARAGTGDDHMKARSFLAHGWGLFMGSF
jgi:hypothetical protein